MLRLLPLILLAGCVLREPVPGYDSSDSATDTDGGGEVGEEDASEAGFARILTANTALTVGGLASINLDTAKLSDGLVETAGDAALALAGESLLVLERFAAGRARLFDPADWETPLVDVVVDGAPYDVEVCREAIVVSRYDEKMLAVLNPLNGEILAEAAVPEGYRPAGLQTIEDTLYVALHALDEETWTPLEGAVAEVDCVTLEVVRTWKVPGVLPTVQAWEGEPGRLVIKLGAFDGLGSVVQLDRERGVISPLIDEQASGLGVADIALSGRRGVALVYDETWRYGVACFDAWDYALVIADQPRAQLVDVAITPAGRVWVAARPPLDDPEGLSGLLVYDLESCESLTGADWFKTDLPPWRVLIDVGDDVGDVE